MQYSIGSVGFGRWHRAGEAYPACQISNRDHIHSIDDVMGDARLTMLRAAFRREPLPEGIFLILLDVPRQAITWEQIRWDTAGPRVTE